MPRVDARLLRLAVDQAFDGTLRGWNKTFRDAVLAEEAAVAPNSIAAGQVGRKDQTDYYVDVRVNFPGRRVRGRLHYLAPGQRDASTSIAVVVT